MFAVVFLIFHDNAAVRRNINRIASVANVTIVLTLMLICFGQAGSLDDSIIAIGFVASLMILALALPHAIFQRIDDAQPA